MKNLELLAPSKNAECGIAAINHGADAVYVGAGKFSARSAAGNTLREIEQLTTYAHRFNAKVYVALNTILFDNELEEAESLIHQVWSAGADALIIQDMGITEMDLPPIPLFASTQADNRTPKHVKFLEHAGFERVILARELSLDTIKTIRNSTTIDLEAFVHGALCVCYSGQCYLSADLGGRSANRGMCGQPCRLPWLLRSHDGNVLSERRHLLSLKDMNRSDYLADLVEAGITSIKIEGRLKDISYVKNITAHYRKRLDAIIEGNSGIVKASSGSVIHYFTPDPVKTFNRGETDYLLLNKKGEIHSFDTPKHMGESVGSVEAIEPRFFTLKTNTPIHNGDGFCFFDRTKRLQGLKVNRADGNRIYPAGQKNLKSGPLRPGTKLFRNYDHVFLKQLDGKSAERKFSLSMTFKEAVNGFELQGTDEDGNTATASITTEKIPAEKKEAARKTLKKQLSKTGDSMFFLNSLSIEASDFFIPTKQLNALRRELLETLTATRENSYKKKEAGPRPETIPYPVTSLDYSANVANKKAEAFYRKHGVESILPAFEIENPGPDTVVMTTRHCLRHALGYCPEESGPIPDEWKEPLILEGKHRSYKLTFHCKRCEMEIHSI